MLLVSSLVLHGSGRHQAAFKCRDDGSDQGLAEDAESGPTADGDRPKKHEMRIKYRAWSSVKIAAGTACKIYNSHSLERQQEHEYSD